MVFWKEGSLERMEMEVSPRMKPNHLDSPTSSCGAGSPQFHEILWPPRSNPSALPGAPPETSSGERVWRIGTLFRLVQREPKRNTKAILGTQIPSLTHIYVSGAALIAVLRGAFVCICLSRRLVLHQPIRSAFAAAPRK